MFRDKNRTRVSCIDCGVVVAASYMKQHMDRQHGGSVPQKRVFDVGWVEPTTYVVSFPLVMKTVKFPVTVCPEVSLSAGRLRDHFMY